MSRFLESPFALRLYVVGFVLIVWAPAPFHHGDAPLGTFVAAFLLSLIPLAFLLRGDLVAWVFLLILQVGVLVINLLVGPRWPVPVEVLLLALLLAPSSRTFAWRRAAPEA